LGRSRAAARGALEAERTSKLPEEPEIKPLRGGERPGERGADRGAGASGAGETTPLIFRIRASVIAGA